METYDAIVIGAGHNGLVCAAYLLQAGYKVLILEKNEHLGGATTTEELIPGFRYNPCAIDHILIHLAPVVEELQLRKYGLEYRFCDPSLFCPHPDGKYFFAHRSLEKTCAEIERYHPRDARRYQEFIEFWQRVLQIIVPVFNAPPKSLFEIASNYDSQQFRELFSVLGPLDKSLDFMRTLFGSANDAIANSFDSEFLKAPLARLAGELSFSPSQKTGAIGLLMMALRHYPGVARPIGGTGALTEALVKLIKHQGGVILAEQPVEKVLIEDGKAVGVRVPGGKEYRATQGVISSLDAKRLFLQLMDASEVDAADPQLRDRLTRRVHNNNETILKIDCALAELPRFAYHNHKDEYWAGSVLIADSVEQVEIAHAEPYWGKIPEDPSMFLAIPTLNDPSMAPEGKHVLWIEFFAPYEIAGKQGTGLAGTGWTDELKERVADRVIDKLAQYTPNLHDAIIARRVESPAELGQRLGTLKGNYYHLDMSFDQMMFFRPLPEIANYTTPIEGLYLTGAGTHPGGAVSGMPGRNCAHVFLQKHGSLTGAITQAGKSLKSMVKSLFGASFPSHP